MSSHGKKEFTEIFFIYIRIGKIDLRALRALRENNNGTPLGGPSYLTSHGVKEITEFIFLMNLKVILRALPGSVRTKLTRSSPPATAPQNAKFS